MCRLLLYIFQLREKLETMKESRELAKKLATVRSLGDISDSVDEDTSAWVERMRDKEKEKKLAEERVSVLVLYTYAIYTM